MNLNSSKVHTAGGLMVGNRTSAGTRKIPGSSWVDPPSTLQIRPLRKPLYFLHLITEEGEKAWLANNVAKIGIFVF